MKNKALASLIDGYEENPTIRDKSFFCRKISGRLSRRSVKFFSPLTKLSDALAYTKLRSYGVVFLVFGLLSIFIEFIKNSFAGQSDNSYSTLIVGASLSLLAAALLAFDKPLCEGLQEWIVTDYIFYDFLRVKRTYTKKSVRGINVLLAIFIGILLAAVGYFIPVYMVASALGALIYLAVSMSSPEFSLFTTLLVLPLTPLFENDRTILCILIGVCSLSFARKVMTGKRFYRFEQYDFVILLMLAFMLVSGVFLGGMKSFVNALFSLILTAGYFVASNVITNRRLFECSLTAVSLSSLPICIITAIQFIRLTAGGESFPSYNINATFSGSGTLSAFLLISTICSYLMLKYNEKKPVGVFFGTLLLFNLAAIILAFRLDSLLVILISSTIISLASKNKKIFVLTIVIYILLHLVYLIPQNAASSFAELINFGADAMQARFSALFASAEVLFKNLLFGVGIGKEPFSEAVYNVCGVAYESSGNLLLQMACEGGIFVSLLFLLLMLIRVRHVYKYFPYAHKYVTSASLSMSGVIYSLLLLGIFENIFTDPAIYSLFFIIFGVGSSMLRTSKIEHDEKQGYFIDTLSLHSSSVDVYLK